MSEEERRFSEALKLFREGHFEEAIQELDDLSNTHPTYTDALEALSLCHEKLNQLDEAIRVMIQLAKTNPNHIMAHANLSRFYMQKGMILEAEREQAESRRLAWKAELKTGKISQGSVDELRLEHEKRLEIENKIERYKKVIALDPTDVLGYFTLGSAYLDLKRYEEARANFAKAVEVNPSHSSSFVNLGFALEALGLKAEAAQIYRQGIQVATERGDIVPLRKMETRLNQLLKKGF